MPLPSAKVLAATLAVALLPGLACALQSDREKEMLTEADYLKSKLEDTGNSELSGNVQIEQGTLKIQSDKATVERAAGVIRRVVLDGSPVQIEQLLDGGGQMQARARTVDYDVVGETLLLTGDVVVTQPEGDMRGERIRYNLKTGQLEGGGAGAGRIKMRLQPGTPKPASPTG